MKLSSKVQALQTLLQPAADACGVVLWGVEFQRLGRKSLLRVYIDIDSKVQAEESTQAHQAHTDAPSHLPKGIGAEDCARVSHQVSALLDVHDPIDGEYVLEVSSPGWDRPFFSVQQMQSFVGQTVQLRLIMAVDNRRKMQGTLLGVDENQRVSITVEGKTYVIDAENVDKANLVYQD